MQDIDSAARFPGLMLVPSVRHYPLTISFSFVARPKISPVTKRSIRFSFRVSASEREQLNALAESCGCAPGILIRHKLFKGKFPEQKLAKVDLGVFLELKKIGVNVNQLTRQVNSGRVPFGLLGLLEKLMAQQDKIIKLLIHDSQSENR